MFKVCQVKTELSPITPNSHILNSSILKRLVIVTIPEISLDQCNTLLLKASSETLHSASLHSE